METLLISLHPRHAKNIFDGRKSIELRKRLPRVGKENNRTYLPEFDFVLIYETTPTAEIVGFCKPLEVVSRTPNEWSRDYKNNLCLSPQEIFNYLRDEVGGDRMGYGIKLRKPQRISPIPLSKMREAGILPPQGYRYLQDADLEKLGIKF